MQRWFTAHPGGTLFAYHELIGSISKRRKANAEQDKQPLNLLNWMAAVNFAFNPVGTELIPTARLPEHKGWTWLMPVPIGLEFMVDEKDKRRVIVRVVNPDEVARPDAQNGVARPDAQNGVARPEQRDGRGADKPNAKNTPFEDTGCATLAKAPGLKLALQQIWTAEQSEEFGTFVFTNKSGDRILTMPGWAMRRDDKGDPEMYHVAAQEFGEELEKTKVDLISYPPDRRTK